MLWQLQPAPGHKAFHRDVLQGFGIFAVSVSGHSSLPAIRSSMARPHLFGSVLNLSFAVMLLVYSSVAAFGYYYFGDMTSQIITTGALSTGSRTFCVPSHNHVHPQKKGIPIQATWCSSRICGVTADLALRAPFAGTRLLIPGLSIASIVNM